MPKPSDVTHSASETQPGADPGCSFLGGDDFRVLSSFRKSEWGQTLDRDSGRNKKMPGRE
jgi:hypothetical protein